MTITLTPPPIAQTEAELRARIGYLDRAADRAEAMGLWMEAEEYRDALDACRDEIARRGARGPEALVRSLDAYDCDRDAVLAGAYGGR